MGYYMGGRGDFYRGYRGDPGFFSFLGGLAKKALGFIPGVGPVLSSAAEMITKKAAPVVERVASSAIVKRGVAAIERHPVLTAAGAAGAAGALAGAGGERMMGSMAGAGRASAGRVRMAGGRRRRMRVTNPKALRRALRRAYGFERLAMKVIHLTHPKKKGRFGGFRRPKRRK